MSTRSHDRRAWLVGLHEAYYPEAFEHFGYPDDLREKTEVGMAGAGIPPFVAAMREQFETYSQL